MKILKYVGIALAAYLFVVVLFESLVGYFQPSNQATLALTVNSNDGAPRKRMLSRIEHNDQLYVAVNHWPRAWFRNLQRDALVEVAFGNRNFPATAVVVTDPMERAGLEEARALPIGFRILTGFPPREFVRLDPRS